MKTELFFRTAFFLIFFGLVVWQFKLGKRNRIRFAPAFKKAHPDNGTLPFSIKWLMTAGFFFLWSMGSLLFEPKPRNLRVLNLGIAGCLVCFFWAWFLYAMMKAVSPNLRIVPRDIRKAALWGLSFVVLLQALAHI